MTEFIFFLCQTDGTIHIIVYREQHEKINQRVLHIKQICVSKHKYIVSNIQKLWRFRNIYTSSRLMTNIITPSCLETQQVLFVCLCVGTFMHVQRPEIGIRHLSQMLCTLFFLSRSFSKISITKLYSLARKTLILLSNSRELLPCLTFIWLLVINLQSSCVYDKHITKCSFNGKY